MKSRESSFQSFMIKQKRWFFYLPYVKIFGLLLITFITASLSDVLAFSAMPEREVINVYSSRHYDTDHSLYERFTQMTGIEINLIEASGDALIERIIAEAHNSPADILLTVDAGRLWRAQQAGLFRPIQNDLLEERIPESLRHPEGYWFAFSKRARVIIYDHNQGVPIGLESYEDLANPAFKEMICIRSSSNIYQLSLLASLIHYHGPSQAERWATGVVANFRRRPQGNDTSQIRAVATGQCRISLVNSYYIGRLLSSTNQSDVAIAEAIGIIFPNQDGNGRAGRGTHINISGGGVLKHAFHPDNAVRFLEYLTHDEAQRIFAEGNNEYPVVPTIPISGPIGDLGVFKEDSLPMSILGERQAEAIMIYDRSGWQ